MRPITEMEANQIYLITGASAANAAFFERESDCKTFLKLADKYLAEYVDINGFQYDKNGWAMIITTKSVTAITESDQKRRARSNKCKEGCAHEEIWSPAVPRDQSQPQERYRPSQQLYEVTATRQASSIFMSCGRKGVGRGLSKLGLG